MLKLIYVSYFKCWPLSPKSLGTGQLLELLHALFLSGSCQFLILSASPVKQIDVACRSQLIHCMPHKQVGTRLACSVFSASAMDSRVVSPHIIHLGLIRAMVKWHSVPYTGT